MSDEDYAEVKTAIRNTDILVTSAVERLERRS